MTRAAFHMVGISGTEDTTATRGGGAECAKLIHNMHSAKEGSCRQ